MKYTKKIIGRFSEDSIKRYLAERIYEKRGLTRAQYIAKCRAAWKNVKYNPEYERKIIVDFSQPVTPAHFFGLDSLEIDFIDAALTELPMSGFQNKTDIECLVFSAGPRLEPDETGKLPRVKINQMFRPAELETEPESLDEKNYFIALFDVLGFSALVREKGGNGVLAIYQDLINKAILNTRYTGFGRIKVGPNQYAFGGFYAPINYAYFSDTIILWTANQFTYLNPFLAKCADLICEALKIGMPLRGSISYGAAVMNKKTNTFIGKAIVEANDIEKGQRWIGATLGIAFMLNEIREALSETLVVPLFCQHFKSEMPLTYPYLTLDWVHRWTAQQNPDLVSTLQSLKERAPEANKAYYDNTIDFVTYVDYDPFEARAVFLRATTYHVKNLSKVNLDKLPPTHPVVIKVKGEIPRCVHLINEEVLEPSPQLRDLLEHSMLFVNRRDHSKFLEMLSNAAGRNFDLTASGVVFQVEKRHIEYIDLFNYDPKNESDQRPINIEIID